MDKKKIELSHPTFCQGTKCANYAMAKGHIFHNPSCSGPPLSSWNLTPDHTLNGPLTRYINLRRPRLTVSLESRDHNYSRMYHRHRKREIIKITVS